METRRWSALYRIVREVGKERPRGSRRMGDWVVVLTLLWAAFTDRPMSWACRRSSWAPWALRWVKAVPSSTTMSRRGRTASVRAFLDAVLERAQASLGSSMVLVIDGKP